MQQPVPAPIDPGLIALAEIFKDDSQRTRKKISRHSRIEIRSRYHITILIIVAILMIILSIVYLTVIGK